MRLCDINSLSVYYQLMLAGNELPAIFAGAYASTTYAWIRENTEWVQDVIERVYINDELQYVRIKMAGVPWEIVGAFSHFVNILDFLKSHPSAKRSE